MAIYTKTQMEHKDAVFRQNTVFCLNLTVYTNQQFLKSFKDHITIHL